MQSRYKHIVDKLRGTGFIIPFMWLVTVVSFAGIVPMAVDFYSSYRGFGGTVRVPEVMGVERVLMEAYIFAVALLPQAVGGACLYVIIAIRADFDVEKVFIIITALIGTAMILYDVYTGYQYHADPSVRDVLIFSAEYSALPAAQKALVHAGIGKAFIVDFILSEVIMAVGWGIFWEILPDAKRYWQSKVSGVFERPGPAERMPHVKDKKKNNQQQQRNQGPRTDPSYAGRPPRNGGGRPTTAADLRESMNQMDYRVPPE